MTNRILVIFFTSFFLIISNTANSNEIYCLDNEGLILPVFDRSDCNNSTDIQIDQDEFRFIIQHDASQRLIKLEDFRKNKKEENSKIASDSSNINSSKKSENDELEKKKLLKMKRKSNLYKKKN